MNQEPTWHWTNRGKNVLALSTSVSLATLLAIAGIACVKAIPEGTSFTCSVGEVQPGDTMIGAVERIAIGQLGMSGDVDNSVITGQVLSSVYSDKVKAEFPDHPNTQLQPQAIISVCANEHKTAVMSDASTVLDIGPIARLENQAQQQS